MDAPEHRVHTRWDQPGRLRTSCARAYPSVSSASSARCPFSKPGNTSAASSPSRLAFPAADLTSGIHERAIVQDTIQMREDFALFRGLAGCLRKMQTTGASAARSSVPTSAFPSAFEIEAGEHLGFCLRRGAGRRWNRTDTSDRFEGGRGLCQSDRPQNV